MILPRGLPVTAPPDQRTRAENWPTLLYSWWCTGCALVIILFRLVGRKVRTNMLFREDKIMMWSIIPLFARMGLVHVILIYGTNNAKLPDDIGQQEILQRQIGSKLVLASRIVYAMFIWMAKWTVSEFLKRLTQGFWRPSYDLVLRGIRIFLIATFIAVIIGTLAECQPFDHYWQVVPDPGPACRQGWAQLFTMGIADIITDLVLVLFPAFIIIHSNFPIKRKISLVLLFSLSVILIVITAYRIPAVIDAHSRQQYRIVWASSEILAASAVANAVVLGSFLRDRGIKKAKYRPYRYGSGTDSISRASASASITRRPTAVNNSNFLDSDEDLFQGMCYRSNTNEDAPKPQRPRKASIPLTESKREKPKWTLPDFDELRNSESDDSQCSGALKPNFAADPMPSPMDTRGQRRVSFFDIGGLLENGDASERSSTLAPSSPASQTSVVDFGNGSRRPSLRPKLENHLSPIMGSTDGSSTDSNAGLPSPPHSPPVRGSHVEAPKPILRRPSGADTRVIPRSLPDWEDEQGMGLALGDAGDLLSNSSVPFGRHSTADMDSQVPISATPASPGFVTQDTTRQKDGEIIHHSEHSRKDNRK